MRFFSVITVVAAAVVAVCALNIDTNAARFARGLPPLRPRDLYTPTEGWSNLLHLLFTFLNVLQRPSEACHLESLTIRNDDDSHDGIICLACEDSKSDAFSNIT